MSHSLYFHMVISAIVIVIFIIWIWIIEELLSSFVSRFWSMPFFACIILKKILICIWSSRWFWRLIWGTFFINLRYLFIYFLLNLFKFSNWITIQISLNISLVIDCLSWKMILRLMNRLRRFVILFCSEIKIVWIFFITQKLVDWFFLISLFGFLFRNMMTLFTSSSTTASC